MTDQIRHLSKYYQKALYMCVQLKPPEQEIHTWYSSVFASSLFSI